LAFKNIFSKLITNIQLTVKINDTVKILKYRFYLREKVILNI
jgi:hypothetical protein